MSSERQLELQRYCKASHDEFFFVRRILLQYLFKYMSD